MTKTKTKKAAAAKKRVVNQQRNVGQKKNNNNQMNNVPRSVSKTRVSRVTRDYLISLLFPSTGPSRIPDICQVTTATLQVTFDFNIVINSSGVGGVYVLLGNWPQIYIELSASSTDATLAYTGGTPIQQGNITGGFAATRVVSASIDVYNTSSDLSNSGLIMSWTQAGNSSGLLEQTPGNANSIASMRDNTTYPYKNGCMVRYKPTNYSSDEFSSTQTIGFTRGQLGVHVSGGTANATARGKLIVNYECIPSGDLLSYQQAQMSPFDTTGMDVVKGIMGRIASFSSYDQVVTLLNTVGTMTVVGGGANNRILTLVNGLINAAGAYVV